MSQKSRERKIQTPDERRASADLLRHQTRQKVEAEISSPIVENAQKIAGQQAEEEAKKQYHEAWQGYYQKYYERYYLAQLQNQQKRVEAQETETDRTKRLKSELLNRLKSNAKKAQKSRHFKPILAGVIVVLVFLFIQFNQTLSAGFYSFVAPSNNETMGIIIADGNKPVSDQPTVLIPKLNVKAPIVMNLPSLAEDVAQASLKNGVIHYPIPGASSLPGQNGNTVILGHSSSDIFSEGNYGFIFVLLNRLSAGDLFYIDFDGTRYAYSVERQEIIAPNDLARLNLGLDQPYATLITCDPIGTNINRLLIIGRQISPDSTTAKTGDNKVNDVDSITGKQPSLFERIFN